MLLHVVAYVLHVFACCCMFESFCMWLDVLACVRMLMHVLMPLHAVVWCCMLLYMFACGCIWLHVCFACCCMLLHVFA